MSQETLDKFKQLCMACRVGDYEAADKLLSAGANVNGVDEFDNSPLFLASLCGHEPLVNLLLERGALCDRDRFDSARCIYGALTDSIRNILLSYDISKAVDVAQPFATHLSSLLSREEPILYDFGFNVSGKLIKVHRFLLMARSTYFEAKLKGSWKDKSVLEMPVGTSPELFQIIINYLYLVPNLFVSVSQEDYKNLIQFTKKLELKEFTVFLEQLRHIMDPKEKASFIGKSQFEFANKARRDICSFVQREIIGKSVAVKQDEKLDDIIEREWTCAPDAFLRLDKEDGTSVIYPCHRSVLIRSEYFLIMFESSFYESQQYQINERGLVDRKTSKYPVLSFPCESEEDDEQVANIILAFLYYDEAEITWQCAVDVLYVADELLIDRLKSMAAVVITQSEEHLQGDDMYEILRTAWNTRVDRLEQYVAKTIAFNLDSHINDPRFKEIVIESSKRITVRHEMDTIELVDDIRYHLAQKWDIDNEDIELLDVTEYIKEFPDILAYIRDNEKIDILLSELGLNA